MGGGTNPRRRERRDCRAISAACGVARQRQFAIRAHEGSGFERHVPEAEKRQHRRLSEASLSNASWRRLQCAPLPFPWPFPWPFPPRSRRIPSPILTDVSKMDRSGIMPPSL